MDLIPITTERLRLRAFTRADLPEFIRYRADPEVARYQSWSDYDEASAEHFYAGQHDLAFDTDGSWFQLAIERKDAPGLLGDVAIHFFDAGRQVELGVTLAVVWQGHGYATEALTAVLDLLLGRMGKHRAMAVVDACNVPVQQLLSGLGFRLEGDYRENIFFKGRWSDERSFALLASEWAQRPVHGAAQARVSR